jgi:hypothetical protein
VFGHKVSEYPSLHDAARHVGGQHQNIKRCCEGELVSYAGFKWRYKGELDGISALEYSMILERAYGETTNLILEYNAKVKERRKQAIEDGEKEPYHYRMVLDALDIVARRFRQRSDNYFEIHKKSKPLNDDGCQNLKNAVIERFALDYETALCEKDEGALCELDDFAKNKAHMYTRLDAEDIASRIVADHKRFKAKARAEIDGIIDITNRFRKKRHAFSEKNNPHRCPLCGGGMFIKSKMKSNVYLVGCTGCNLTEVVTIQS